MFIWFDKLLQCMLGLYSGSTQITVSQLRSPGLLFYCHKEESSAYKFLFNLTSVVFGLLPCVIKLTVSCPYVSVSLP